MVLVPNNTDFVSAPRAVWQGDSCSMGSVRKEVWTRAFSDSDLFPPVVPVLPC